VRGTILHSVRVFAISGLPLFIRDMVRAYPEFHHVVVYMQKEKFLGPIEYNAMEAWRGEYGCEVDGATMITRQLVREVDPSLHMIHSVSGRWFAGDAPFYWLGDYPTIFMHHWLTRPTFAVDADVFVSKFVENQLKDAWPRMKRRSLCPPVIDTGTYTAIERHPHMRCAIGKICSNYDVRKYPNLLFSAMRRVGEAAPHTSFLTTGAEKYFPKGPGIPRFTNVANQTVPVQQLLRDLDVFVYTNDPTLPETWCRAVTEAMAAGLPVVGENRGGIAEQITDGVDGFLCTTEDEFVDRLTLLANDPQLRVDMGMAARKKAVAHFGFDRLRREFDPYVFHALMGVL